MFEKVTIIDNKIEAVCFSHFSCHEKYLLITSSHKIAVLVFFFILKGFESGSDRKICLRRGSRVGSGNLLVILRQSRIPNHTFVVVHIFSLALFH